MLSGHILTDSIQIGSHRKQESELHPSHAQKTMELAGVVDRNKRSVFLVFLSQVHFWSTQIKISMAERRGSGLPWAASVKEELARVTKARHDATSRSQRRMICKVPPYLRMLKPEQYDCQLLCFGLYNRDFQGLSWMDKLRLEVVSEFLEQSKIQGPNSWDSLCDQVAGSAQEAEALLNLHEDDHKISLITPDLVRSVLTLDAVFLVALMSFWYFNYTSAGTNSSHGNRGFWAIFERVGVKCHTTLLFSDMWLFENQIPLFRIHRVWNLVYDHDVDMDFNNFLKPIVTSAVETFTLGYSGDHSLNQDISFETCDHLLGCLYNLVCSQHSHDTTTPSLYVEDNTRQLDYDPSARAPKISSYGTARSGSQHSIRRSILSTFQPVCTSLGAVLTSFAKPKQVLPRTQSHTMSNLLSVTELQKAGIRVKGVETSISGIRFESSSYFKATLFLPRIDIDDNSERILWNLCAYELASESDHKFMCYLAVMDALIDSPDDVRLLRKGKEPVIALNYLGDDRDVAILFNNLLQKLSIRFSQDMKSLIIEVHDWYTSPIRHQVTRYVSRFHARPWLFVSVIAANILFVLTGLQTVYSMLSYYYP